MPKPPPRDPSPHESSTALPAATPTPDRESTAPRGGRSGADRESSAPRGGARDSDHAASAPRGGVDDNGDGDGESAASSDSASDASEGSRADDPLLASIDPADLPDATESMRLVVEAQGGDGDALEELLRRYEGRLQRIVSIRLSTKLRRCVESVDIVQQTYASAWRKIGELELRGTGCILNWLARIAENHMLDTHRRYYNEKRNRDREVYVDAARRPDDSFNRRDLLVARGPRPDEAAEQRELERLVDECMAELPDEYREVIMLRTYCGGSWDYVSRELGHVSSEASRQLHRRARIRLARIVRERLAQERRAAAGGGVEEDGNGDERDAGGPEDDGEE